MEDAQYAAAIEGPIVEELRRMEGEVWRDQRGHSEAATRFNALHYLVGLPAIVLAAAAGATFLIDTAAEWVAPLCAFLASALSAMATFLKPDQAASQHQASAVRLAALERRIRQQILAFYNTGEPRDSTTVNSQMVAISEEITQVQEQARAIPAFARRAARRRALKPR